MGLTQYKDMGELIGQGTFGEALVSGLNLDKEVMDSFTDSEDELYYGEVRIQPMLYQDDIIRLSSSREKVQNGNDRIEAIMKSKQLEVHPEKSCFLVVDNGNKMQEIRNEIK